jgi:hypothetical protein
VQISKFLWKTSRFDEIQKFGDKYFWNEEHDMLAVLLNRSSTEQIMASVIILNMKTLTSVEFFMFANAKDIASINFISGGCIVIFPDNKKFFAVPKDYMENMTIKELILLEYLDTNLVTCLCPNIYKTPSRRTFNPFFDNLINLSKRLQHFEFVSKTMLGYKINKIKILESRI